MPYVLVRHKVQDYAKWKPVFDEDEVADGRKAMGSRGGGISTATLMTLMSWCYS